MYGKKLLESIKARKEGGLRVAEQREKDMRECKFDLDDCFVSVHSNRLMNMLYDTQIEILENGGFSSFLVLLDLKGKLVADKLLKTRYGPKFRTKDGVWVDPFVREGTLTRKGYNLGRANRAAWAKLDGNNMASLRPIIFQSRVNYWTGEEV